MDLEREQERQTYRLCRLGFAILSFALVVACLSTMVTLPRLFAGRAFLPWLHNSVWWGWIDVPIVWGCLVGTYLLWGRWNNPSWQRRSGLLVVMCVIDVVLWLLEHGEALGLRTEGVGHHWLRESLGQALSWPEFALLASLACEVLVHLGVTQAAETGKATRSLAGTGAVIYLIFFCEMTDWKAWPLVERRLTAQSLLLLLGMTMIGTIALIQVTALTIATCRQCAAVLDEMDREDDERDPLKSASVRDIRFQTSVPRSVNDREPPGPA